MERCKKVVTTKEGPTRKRQLRLQNQRQQGHTDEHAVFHLAEVGGPGVGIDFDSDLVDPREWVQNCQTRRRLCQQGGVYHVAALRK